MRLVNTFKKKYPGLYPILSGVLQAALARVHARARGGRYERLRAALLGHPHGRLARRARGVVPRHGREPRGRQPRLRLRRARAQGAGPPGPAHPGRRRARGKGLLNICGRGLSS